MLGLTFSSKFDWKSYITSIAKTASKKIGALIWSMKFLSPEVALSLFKSIICPCMEQCCHVWVGAPSCYLELLDKLTNMHDCWFFTCCFSSTLGSSSKCGQLKSFLQLLFWQIFFGAGSTGSTFFFVYLLFRQIT